MGSIASYRDLKVWQLAMDLAVATYRLTNSFPDSERFGLTSQMRRSAASISANIAEGYGHDSTGSYVHFLKTARGSLKELESHIILASRVGLLEEAALPQFLTEAASVGRLLNSLINALQDRDPRGFSETEQEQIVHREH